VYFVILINIASGFILCITQRRYEPSRLHITYMCHVCMYADQTVRSDCNINMFKMHCTTVPLWSRSASTRGDLQCSSLYQSRVDEALRSSSLYLSKFIFDFLWGFFYKQLVYTIYNNMWPMTTKRSNAKGDYSHVSIIRSSSINNILNTEHCVCTLLYVKNAYKHSSKMCNYAYLLRYV
jgi:hypothetical protein